VGVEQQKRLRVAQRYAVSQTEEPAVVIGLRDYHRLIERLDGCKPGGWADLWLAVAGAAAGLTVSALVGVLSLLGVPSEAKGVLWALTAAGAIMFCVCVFGYLSQRGNPRKEIIELKKDLEIRMPISHKS
jgi:VIT1/CCC1 family predicted Fe2+/Mn2+ transporter